MTGFWMPPDYSTAGQLDTERQARQKAQAELAVLKGVIAKAGLALQRAVLAERESCAKVCEDWANDHSGSTGECDYNNCGMVAVAVDLAEAIRAMGAS